MKQLRQHPLVTGTLILTLTGFVSRIIGFFYRIYLSRLFGEEGMGIYQLLSPVLALTFSLTAAAYQTAISKLVAESAARRKGSPIKPLLAGLSFSLPLSLICTGIVFCLADYIGTYILLEERTVSMLRILAFSIPLSAVHSCINGYFYGMKKTAFPAAAQLIEQLIRVGSVFCISSYALCAGRQITINVAVVGLAVGELASMLLSVAAIYLHYIKYYCRTDSSSPLPPLQAENKAETIALCKNILYLALPLTANRLVLNILQSVETISIPARLRLFGYDTSTALSVYGVLTGMAMPLIFFPNALTGSIAVLLLPIISEKYALGQFKAVRLATLRTVKYCLILGFSCLILFVFSGNLLGVHLFDSPLAGHFITTLGFICPFIYLNTTLQSILQGLGMTMHIFITNIISLLLRLMFVFLAIPQIGITGYLWGLLVSQLLHSALYLFCLRGFLRKHGTQ